MESAVIDTDLAPLVQGAQPPRKKRKKTPIDPKLTLQSNQQNQAATAAFLSALVAAASATANQPQVLDPQPLVGFFPPCASYPDPNQGFAPSDAQNAGIFGITPLQTQLQSDSAMQATNEDLVRALQEVDVNKLAAILKSLGDAAAFGYGAPGHMNGGPSGHIQNGQPSMGKTSFPVSAAAILGLAPKESQTRELDEEKAKKALLSMPSAHPDGIDEDHAHLLATKWMNAGKLAELVKTRGLVYKKGKFSAVEEAQIKTAIANYRAHKDLTEEQLNELIYAKGAKAKDTAFWSEITAQVPQRPIIAVYHHVRRTCHPMKQKGKWVPAEDEFLRASVAELGQCWEKVSLRVGRMAADCRDRWRNHIANRELRVSGAWSKEEEEELTQIVTEMTVAQGRDQDNDVFWGQVAERMGNRRGRQQCRIKWTDSLSKTLKNEGNKPRWSQQDAYVLVHKIASMNVPDDSEIDWKLLPDHDWNLWSAHSLQRRWLTLKRSIRGYEEMTHQEIMDILRVKKAQPPTTGSPRKRVVSSAAVVVAEEAEVEGETSGDGAIMQPIVAAEMLGGIVEAECSKEVEGGVEENEDGSSSSSSSSSSDDSSNCVL